MTKASRILIDKSERTLTIIFPDGTEQRLTGLRFGKGWKDGPKRRKGDERTPEGDYHVQECRETKADAPGATYIPALYLDYPNEHDRAEARKLGIDPGGAVMIHGPHPKMPLGVMPPWDWTDGCAALPRSKMRDLMKVAWQGMPVSIRA